MMLSGAGGTARWTMNETGWGDKADAESFLAVCPEGTPIDPSRPASFRNNPLLWHPGSDGADADPRTAQDIQFIDQLIEEIVAQFGADPRRIFLTGFSNGASMAFRLGTDLSGRFAALAPVAGECRLHDPWPARPLPTLFLVGTADPLIPLEGGEVVAPWGWSLRKPPVRETVRRWAQALGCPSEPVAVRQEPGFTVWVYGPGREGAALEVYQIDGLGHHWPGGKGRLNPEIAGPPQDTLRATDVIWDFFRRHSMYHKDTKNTK
jgi:polyhydroxybutyrate depolymerase